jgi:hypothetical protein
MSWGVASEPHNNFQGAATETEPPEATFGIEPATLGGYPPGLVSLCSFLALVAWLTAPAVVWIVWRAAL